MTCVYYYNMLYYYTIAPVVQYILTVVQRVDVLRVIGVLSGQRKRHGDAHPGWVAEFCVSVQLAEDGGDLTAAVVVSDQPAVGLGVLPAALHAHCLHL